MDEKIVEAVARAICISQELDPDLPSYGHPGGPAWQYYLPEARAAIEAHTAALADAGFVIVPREPTMPAMQEIFGRGPVDGIPLAEAERRFRKAIEVLAVAPDQRR
jgi:hypothetical protein